MCTAVSGRNVNKGYSLGSTAYVYIFRPESIGTPLLVCIYPRRIRMLGERPYNQEEGEIQTEPDLNTSKFFFMTYSPN